MAMYYYLDGTGIYGNFQYVPWIRGFIFHSPSECCMLIPVSFAEMALE